MKKARYDKIYGQIFKPMIEELKSFKAELVEKPLVDFVEQAP